MNLSRLVTSKGRPKHVASRNFYLPLTLLRDSVMETLLMKPDRNFRLANKKEAFILVGFRYDQMESLEYIQRKSKEPILEAVSRLLSTGAADVISIRRVYLDQEVPIEDKNVNNSKVPIEGQAAL